MFQKNNNNSIPEISSTFKTNPSTELSNESNESEGSKRLGAESLESSRLGAFLTDLVVSKMITPEKP